MAKEKLIISADGTVRGINSPLVDQVTKALGDQREIRRASHVDPTNELRVEAREHLVQQGWDLSQLNNKWWADMLVDSGPVVLGPFNTRDEALAAEVTWLQMHGLPIRGG